MAVRKSQPTMINKKRNKQNKMSKKLVLNVKLVKRKKNKNI